MNDYVQYKVREMLLGDLNILFTDPSIRRLTGAIQPGCECVFTGVYVSAVFSQRVAQFPVIGLGLHSGSAQPESRARVGGAVLNDPGLISAVMRG